MQSLNCFAFVNHCEPALCFADDSVIINVIFIETLLISNTLKKDSKNIQYTTVYRIHTVYY